MLVSPGRLAARLIHSREASCSLCIFSREISRQYLIRDVGPFEWHRMPTAPQTAKVFGRRAKLSQRLIDRLVLRAIPVRRPTETESSPKSQRPRVASPPHVAPRPWTAWTVSGASERDVKRRYGSSTLALRYDERHISRKDESPYRVHMPLRLGPRVRLVPLLLMQYSIYLTSQKQPGDCSCSPGSAAVGFVGSNRTQSGRVCEAGEAGSTSFGGTRELLLVGRSRPLSVSWGCASFWLEEDLMARSIAGT